MSDAATNGTNGYRSFHTDKLAKLWAGLFDTRSGQYDNIYRYREGLTHCQSQTSYLQNSNVTGKGKKKFSGSCFEEDLGAILKPFYWSSHHKTVMFSAAVALKL